ncbi:glycosyltransferase family 2 protein [Sphingomonas sp. CV7422]|uniref:glycosyltransferase family 2 protein n=1 Tax=Sphingomonas sp. CV7422 TaxID=3018036 RepID=UPI0022FDE744|nr:glycosyltransferase family 2 protein [Sphingomonas sp. CV7422]
MTHIFPNSMAKLRDDRSDDSVDIVMRTKNRPALLGRALSSVVNQQHRQWNLYLINDGGDPAPVDQLVATFADELAGRVTVVHHPDSLGMAAAANRGMTLGTAAFVAAHDDDDSWDETYLARCTGHLLAPENRRFGGVLTKWNKIGEVFDGSHVELREALVDGYDGTVLDFLEVIRTPRIPPIALLWRRNVVNHIGFLNPHLPIYDDWDLIMRGLQIADIALLPDALANYHLRITADAGDYANTITEWQPIYHTYDILYRNGLLRALFDRDPTQLGLVVNLLKNAEHVRGQVQSIQIASHRELSGNDHHLDGRLTTLETEVRESRRLLEQLCAAVGQPA